MNDKKSGKVKDEELSLEQLIEQLKQTLLVEGTRKLSEDDIGKIMRHWMNEDKKH